MNNSEDKELDISEIEMDFLLENKYKLAYSNRLARKVYTLKEWVDKEIFKRHKKLFGYTDIGWTVKHPKQLTRVLIKEGVWSIDLKELEEYSNSFESAIE